MHNEREENSITRPRETGQTQRLARWAIGIGLVSLTVGIVSGVAQRLAKPTRENLPAAIGTPTVATSSGEVSVSPFATAELTSSTPQTENSVGERQNASEEARADAQSTPTPKANEEVKEIEDMNDWRGHSPDNALFAVTRLIPDSVYIQRHDLDGVAVEILRFRDEKPILVARHDFGQRIIDHIEWSPDSKFLLFTTTSWGGHSPWYTPAFLFCVADKSFRNVDAAIGSVVGGEFQFEPPDIAILLVQKGDKPEEDVKVSLAKIMQKMPRIK